MVPRRVRRPLLVALLALLALAPAAGQLRPALAASLTFAVTTTAGSHDAAPGDGVCADAASQCSLRAAVEEADAQPTGSAVTTTIPAGAYLLSLGTLNLTHNTIALAGAGVVATIGGVTLSGGNAGSGRGGGLANLGVTILSRSAVVSGTANNGGRHLQCALGPVVAP